MAIQDILNAQRLTRIVRDLQDELRDIKPLTFLDRVPLGNVYDNREILATYSGKVYAANIVQNDAEATVVETGKMTYSAGRDEITNIKIGAALTQDEIEKADLLARQLDGVQGDIATQLKAYQFRMASQLVQGVRETMNWLCVGMLLDGVKYNKGGVIIDAGFGTPANLKSTLVDARRWIADNKNTMDAVTDLQALALQAQFNYGRTFTRVDMATTMFQLIIQSKAFQDQIKVYHNLDPAANTGITIYNVNQAKNLFELISGFTLNLEDKTITFKGSDKRDNTSRVLPENKVILSSPADDNDDTKFDFAQGVPEEVKISRIVKNIPTLTTTTPGIVSYYDSDTHMNPPQLRAYAVVKGFPRKFDVYVNGILTVS